jgi:thioesterase domain-containing protein
MRDLTDIWKRVLQCQSIGPNDDFFEKGGDSLLASAMLQQVAQLTGRALKNSILFDAPTLWQFTQAVVQSDNMPAGSLYPVGLDTGGALLFFFHGDLTTGGYYLRRLADLLGDGARIFAVAPYHEPIPASIEQMAREFFEMILKVQPTGPFRLAGLCNGGTVAFEVAHLLRSAGHEVAFLGLLDVPVMNAGGLMRLFNLCISLALHVTIRETDRRKHLLDRCLAFIWRLHGQAERFLNASYQVRMEKLTRNLRYLIRWGEPEASNSSALQVPQSEQMKLLRRIKTYSNILGRYIVRPLDVPITYFSCEQSGHHLRRITSRLEIIKMPGDHLSCVTGQMHVTAAHLRSRLQSTTQSSAVATVSQTFSSPRYRAPRAPRIYGFKYRSPKSP